jgi:hypothetical protein
VKSIRLNRGLCGDSFVSLIHNNFQTIICSEFIMFLYLSLIKHGQKQQERRRERDQSNKGGCLEIDILCVGEKQRSSRRGAQGPISGLTSWTLLGQTPPPPPAPR